MFKKSVCFLLLVSVGFLSSGCCSIMHGNRQLVSFTSEPAGAKVKVNGIKGTTPFTASLARNQDYVATISKEGYKEEQAQINKSMSMAAIFGNILWLLVGAIVDFASGSAYNLNPTTVNVELEKE